MINRFNEKAEVILINKVDNGRGGWKEERTSLGFFWTYHSPLSSDKKVQYAQNEIEHSTRFYFQYNEQITENCLILYKGLEYKIIEISPPEEQGFFMEVLCDGKQ
jgi:SPP1 family predicted phage head-tail adaptor